MRNLAFIIFLVSAFLLSADIGRSESKHFVVTTEEWPPFVSSDLPDQGWAMEVVRAALEPQGYDVSLRLLPWARAVRCAKSGECDGLYLAYFSEERGKWFVFSDSIGEVRTGFFKLKDRDIEFSDLAELEGVRIGLTRGAAVSDEFDNADYLNKVEVGDDEINVRKLLRGRVDLVAAADPVFWHVVNTSVPKEEAEKIEFIAPPLSRQYLHMAISKNSPDYTQKLHDFNAGLKRIRNNGTYEAILREHGF